MPAYTQDTRPYRLTTPLGPDVLLCTRWLCSEAVSSLFELRIECVSERRDIAPRDLLLKTVSLLCKPIGGSGTDRHFTGIVRHVERSAGGEGPMAEYTLHVVPPAWLLDQGTGFQIHQDKDLQAILRDTLPGITLDWQVQGTLSPAPSRTRYNESRWDFATRLLEREGVWFAFRSTAQATTLLMANTQGAATALHGVTELRDADWVDDLKLMRASIGQRPFVSKLVVGTSQPGLFGRENREQMQAPSVAASPGGWALDASAFPDSLEHQLYEFVTGSGRDAADKSGGATASELGKLVDDLKAQATLRGQAETASSSRVHGESTAVGLTAGAKVGLHCQHESALNGQYFVISVEHFGENGSYEAADGASPSYQNRFTAIPHAMVYRPPRAAWPTVQGMHVATVVGPSGEEIFTDELGRVRVVFEWDRTGRAPNGPGDACWLRVAQLVAGAGWGAFFLPRVGQQVLVAFLEGDPDSPLVVGSLYNATNMPQIRLPDDKTQSGIRTRSSPQGSAETYNELRFEDKKDAEQVVFQAQRDFLGVIKHDSTLTVKEGNQTVTLEKGDQTLTITEGKYTISVKQDHTTTVEEGSMVVTVSAGDQTTTVEQGKAALVADGEVAFESKSAKMSLTASQDIAITSSGGKVVVDAPSGIELTCSGNSIKITPSGIEINGMMIKASASGTAEVTAGATLTLKGAMTMIN